MLVTRLAAAILAAALVPAPAPAATDCAAAAERAMPEGGDHLHAEASQHDFACGLESVAYLDLMDLVPERQEFGEADVAGSIVAVALAYPQAGFLLFDVSNPRRTRALSLFRAEACETVVMDYDCGADVKLSDDGTLAFLALQRSRVPEGEPAGTKIAPARVGVVVVDVSDPRNPREIGFTPIAPRGTHLLAYRRIRGVEYVYAVHNGVGFSIYRLTRPASLRLVADVKTKAAHDVHPYDDPVDGKTYLYFSGANAGMFFYDVTNPARPVLKGEWVPPVTKPREGWYVHTAWTFRRGARRFTLVGPELSQPGQDHATLPAPLWMLDTTDHARPRLVGQWSNPAKRAAGALGFSVHNFWFDQGRTWVAHYHGGVWLLDWNAVLDGTAQAPAVLGFYVPHGSTRAFVNVRPRRRFLSAFEIRRRPMVWDVVSDGRYAYVSDITGGFSVLTPARESGARAPRSDNRAPLVAVAVLVALVGLGVRLLVRRRRSVA